METNGVRRVWRVVAGVVAACAGSVVLAQEAQGPSAYPAKPEDWPGKGVIRTFGWMNDNRTYFWKNRAKDQGAVVFAGDSLTGGWKDPGAAFPGLKVANRGIGGDTSRGLLFRYAEDVLALKPKAVVILIGQNDLTARGKPADAVSNIAGMLAQTEQQTPGTPVILCTVPPSANPKAPVSEADRQALNAGIRELGKGKAHVAICDLYAAMGSADGTPKAEYFGPDMLHFSAAGHAKRAELIAPLLAQLGVK